MTLRITQYGEHILRQKGSPMTSFDDNLTELANQMLEAMEQADGIGLAAQQIGQAHSVLRSRCSRSSGIPDDMHSGR